MRMGVARRENDEVSASNQSELGLGSVTELEAWLDFEQASGGARTVARTVARRKMGFEFWIWVLVWAGGWRWG